jgi:sulfur carrier protein ThiS
MHRGSSKGAGSVSPAPETLPLSASPQHVTIVFHVVRAGRDDSREVRVAIGQTLRSALRAAGLPPEGCAVLHDQTPWALDRVIDQASALTVIPTFSGG